MNKILILLLIVISVTFFSLPVKAMVNPDLVSYSNSYITSIVGPTGEIINDSNINTNFPIDVHIKNCYGDPLENVKVYLFTTTYFNGSIDSSDSLTDAAGVATFYVQSRESGTVTFKARTNDTILQYGFNVTFKDLDHPFSSQNSYLTTIRCPDGSLCTQATQDVDFPVDVYIKDTSGNPLPNKQVSLYSENSTAAWNTPSLTKTSNSSGIATFYVKGTTTGSITFRAKVDGIAITSGLTMNILSPSVPIPPSPITKNIFSYGKERLSSLYLEQQKAIELKAQLELILGKGQIGVSAQNWHILVNSYIYGEYTPTEIAHTIKYGPEQVHPTIPAPVWRNR